MKPTPAQLAEIAEAMWKVCPVDTQMLDLSNYAGIAWDLIAPIVRAQALEDAATALEDYRAHDIGISASGEYVSYGAAVSIIRALKETP